MIIAAGPEPSGGGLAAPPPELEVGAGPVLDPDGVEAAGAPPGRPLEGVRANREADLFWHAPAVGVHEPIAGAVGLADTLAQWRERLREHAGAACRHLVADGATLPAAELFALPFVPSEIARERERFGAYATRTMGGNLLGDLVQEEVRKRDRVVAIDDEGVLLAAFAARAPYQLLLTSRVPRPRFEDDGALCAGLLAEALGRLDRHLGRRPALQLWVRTAPSGAEHFAWRIDIVPVPARIGGLERGAGIPVNPVSPEHAAAELRAA